MRNVIGAIACVFLAGAMLCGSALDADARGRGRGRSQRPRVVKGAPAASFSGTITSVQTDGATVKITCSGSFSGGTGKGSGGSTTFQVDPFTYINSGGGGRGSSSDLGAGQAVSISYAKGLGGTYSAKSITIGGGKASAGKKNTGKKNANKRR